MTDIKQSNTQILYGTDDDDELTGGIHSDIVYGFAGNDKISGGSGDDVIYGGLGDDQLNGQDGNDIVFGEEGNDSIFGGAGNDYLVGGSGNDTISGDQGDDILFGGDGNDLIYDFYGNNRLFGGDGRDTFYTYTGTNFLFGEAGDDRFFIYGATNTIDTGSGNHHIAVYGNGDQTITSYDGKDYIYMSPNVTGNDIINSGGGDDTIFAGNGNDIIESASGNNIVHAENGDDTVTLGTGQDQVYDGSGHDRILTGSGNDIVYHTLADNINFVDFFDLGEGVDTVKITVDASIFNQTWFQKAINDFNAFIGSNPVDSTFDFSTYDPTNSLFKLTVKNTETLIFDVIGDINNPPSNIQLSNNLVAENSVGNSPIGTVTSSNDEGETPQYKLIDDAGGRFTLDSSSGVLFVAENIGFDFEMAQQYHIKVEVSDGNGLTSTKDFTINITDVNEAPWDIALSNQSIAEDAVPGTFIGTVTSKNDAEETATYSLLDDADGLLTIDSDGNLFVADGATLDFETMPSLAISVLVTDSTGLESIQDFTINVTDVVETDPLPINFKYSGLLDGGGQTVAVLDTGIDYNLSALGGGFGADHRVVGGFDFVNNDGDPFDAAPAIHGTHVSSIIGSSGSQALGWARDVDFVGVKVLSRFGSGTFSGIEKGLQWVLANLDSFENPITTINMSLGASTHTNDPPFSQLEDEFQALEAAGVFISVAAGNGFAGRTEPGLGYPASSPFVVPVASHVSSGNALNSFSQRNDKVIAADGDFVQAYVPNHNGGAEETASLSGTSMAAPQVAGAAILLRELMEITGQENVTQDVIYDHMRATADMIFDPITNINYHKLNMVNAVNALLPEDEHGDDAANATSLGIISTDQIIQGFIDASFIHDLSNNGRITGISSYDIDFFSFTAGETGTISFNATPYGLSEIAPEWIFSGESTVDGHAISFAVEAGNDYSIGFTSDNAIGLYQVNISYDGIVEPDVVNIAKTQVENPVSWSDIFGQGPADVSNDAVVTTPVLSQPGDYPITTMLHEDNLMQMDVMV